MSRMGRGLRRRLQQPELAGERVRDERREHEPDAERDRQDGDDVERPARLRR